MRKPMSPVPKHPNPTKRRAGQYQKPDEKPCVVLACVFRILRCMHSNLDCCKMCLHGVTRAPEMMHDPKKTVAVMGTFFSRRARFFHVLRLRFFHVLPVGPKWVHDPKKTLTGF